MSNTQLTIFVSRTSVHVAEVLRSNQELVFEKGIVLPESTPEGYKKRLSEFFDELNLKEEYSEYSLAWATQYNTLVPLKAFNESSAKSIFQLMFGKKQDEKTIDFNRLMELNKVNVFEVPDWVKFYFIMKFPRVLIQHEHTMTLRAIFQKNAFKRKVVVAFMDDYVTVDVVFHDELTFSNSFEFQNASDVIYHFLFVLEQEKLKEENGDVYFYYTNRNTLTVAEEVKSQLEKLKLLEKYKIVSVDSLLKLQTLCV